MKIVDLLRRGLISPETKIVWKRRIQQQEFVAVIGSDGSITTSDGKKHKTPSGAAKHLNGNKPVDGWLAWKLQSTGESLADIRIKAQ
jgi:hypothetical protein